MFDNLYNPTIRFLLNEAISMRYDQLVCFRNKNSNVGKN